MPTSVVSEWVQKLKERLDFMTSITTGTIRFNRTEIEIVEDNVNKSY